MTQTQIETEMRQQLIDVFSNAEYPVTEPFELIPVLPEGAETTFEAGDVTLGAMDIGMGYAEYQDYPYQTADSLVDDLMSGLRDDNIFS